jgi:hypothetical protein
VVLLSAPVEVSCTNYPAFGLIFYGEQSPTGILGSGFNTSMVEGMIQLKAELRF